VDIKLAFTGINFVCFLWQSLINKNLFLTREHITFTMNNPGHASSIFKRVITTKLNEHASLHTMHHSTQYIKVFKAKNHVYPNSLKSSFENCLQTVYAQGLISLLAKKSLKSTTELSRGPCAESN
jgi:hypothetical protein